MGDYFFVFRKCLAHYMCRCGFIRLIEEIRTIISVSNYGRKIVIHIDTNSQFKDMIFYLKAAHESDVAEKSSL